MSAKCRCTAPSRRLNKRRLLDTGPITNHVNFVNNRNGKFAYVTIGGLGVVKVFRRGPTPQLIATIPVGDLPHGIWPSGDGSRVYVALENGVQAVVIDTLTNQVIANVPIGQTTQALVYVPNAVPNGTGTENLVPLGEAGNTARLHLRSRRNRAAGCAGIGGCELARSSGPGSDRSGRADAQDRNTRCTSQNPTMRLSENSNLSRS